MERRGGDDSLVERLMEQVRRAGHAADVDAEAHARRIAEDVERRRAAGARLRELTTGTLRDMPTA